ncbi:hypothetical protein [Lignipirellula cremea]|uniref:Uncharacterized protein n=1 Tax=Lignipirellula cremea TaxID=2528010 RepID=A0A518DW80_9BACT|nr:hypothetical protein [Lignipirellula cremea]QDU96092.1 hypothetical protein Pla8534_39110 [Lignipirellula cremea]
MSAIENVKTLNSVVRTALATALLAAAGVASWMGFNTYNASSNQAAKTQQELTNAQEKLEQTATALAERDKQFQAVKLESEKKDAVIEDQVGKISDLTISNAKKDVIIEEKDAVIVEQVAEIEHLDTAMRLLKVDHRLARLKVLGISKGDDGMVHTDLEFTEINDEGEPIDGIRRFQVNGDMVYVDAWIVKFDDHYVEEADLARATSLVLFHRIFGEKQSPQDGFSLDVPGTRPTAYARGTAMSEFEKNIWDEFWTIANDQERAHAMGIRAAHGQAVSIKAEPGKTYLIELRASDGLSLKPEDAVLPSRNPQLGVLLRY